MIGEVIIVKFQYIFNRPVICVLYTALIAPNKRREGNLYSPPGRVFVDLRTVRGGDKFSRRLFFFFVTSRERNRFNRDSGALNRNAFLNSVGGELL